MSNKQRRLLIIATAALLAGAGSAQAWSWNASGERINGSGEAGSEVREVGVFDGISTSGGFKVLIRQGASNRLELKADNNLLAYFETKVVEGSKGRVLEVSPKRGYNLHTTITPQLVLDMPQLRSISIAGSGDIKVEAMKTPAVEASISGSGNIIFDKLESERLGLKVSGSGDVVAAGRTQQLSVSVAGSGDVKARALEADEVKVSIAGSGDAKVTAVKKLNVSIAGSGDVSYAGSPEISMSVAGSGKVKKLDK
ncbi:head GIN domain-containing protein [Roseateles violae]|uniref:Head GIN domain-containing protein n=1 Tax=Roseateles violae TaxID=3058042 RepID=A0ABT8DTK0_9BURK|nr:head GIN domain-containing protein [Pelomonas sp. PFR6]MDN3921396.1 head GIN domain-containing protein [Pelomonas sp. PFR6]